MFSNIELQMKINTLITINKYTIANRNNSENISTKLN